MDSMKSDIVNKNEKIDKLEMIVDWEEQYSHNNCLITSRYHRRWTWKYWWFSFRNFKWEMLNDLNASDLDRNHSISLRKASSNNSRAAIIKFISYNTKKYFFKMKNF